MTNRLNVIIFSLINFLAGLISLFIIQDPVPISIAGGFIVGDLGSKWILLLFLTIGLLIPAINFTGKQNSQEQIALAERRELYLNIMLTVWVVIIYFFVSMFNSQDIIGSKVYINILSLIVLLISCGLSLFSKCFVKLHKKDNFIYNCRLYSSIFVSQIVGYVLFVVAVINIFINSLIFIIPFVVVGGAVVYFVPLFIQKKHIRQQQKEEQSEKQATSEDLDKLNSALLYAGLSNADIDIKEDDLTAESTTEIATQPVEEAPRSKSKQKSIAKTRAKQAKPATKSSSTRSKTTTKSPQKKTTNKKSTTSKSAYTAKSKTSVSKK